MLTYNTYVVFLEACELLHSLTDSHTTKGRVTCVYVSASTVVHSLLLW